MDRNELNGLIKEVKKQDETAFEKLFDACKKETYGFLYVYTKNAKDAKNLLKKTFVKVRETIQEHFDGTDAFAWILKIAHNIALEYLKRNNKGEEDKKTDETVAEDKKGTGVLPSIYEIINKNFEDTDRQILVLRLAFGYKNKEVAEILHIPNATVPWKYGNTIKRLKELLLEAGYQIYDIGNIFVAENEKTDIKLFKDISKTPIQQPAHVVENEKTSQENFFISKPFISAVCCLLLALILFLISVL